MRWIRCNVCGDLKQEIEYYKNGDDRRKTCKKCMKEKYNIDKKKKKEYDRQRYLKLKEKKIETKNTCMRCGKYYANVRHNQLEWCFYCLFKYEKQYNRKFKVEIILPYYKKVKYDK